MNQDKYINIIRSAIQAKRHPEPPAHGLFQPTSVIALFVLDKEAKLLFIQKADIKGYPWRNQMAFPGGHKDTKDQSTKDTALRELSEEMGISQENVELIGSIGNFQTINNKDIKAWLGVWNQKENINYDKSEISRVFQIPFNYLINMHKEKGFDQYKPNVTQLVYPYEDVLIWGVTAKILYHLIETLLEHSEQQF